MPLPPLKNDLQQSVQFLKGVGPARAEVLEKLGIRTVADLLFHLPRSYDDLSDVRDIASLEANGEIQTVRGEIVEVQGKELPDGRRIVSVILSDAKGKLVEGTWFNQIVILRTIRYGMKVAFSGKPKWFRDHWQMNHPRVEKLDSDVGTPTRAVVPVYPLTENLHPDKLRELIKTVVESYADLIEDILPAELRQRRGFTTPGDHLREVHFPEVLAQAKRGRTRFVYEEFLLLQVALAVRRRELRDRQQATPLPVDAEVDKHIRRLFPFELTGDQNKAVAAISRDLARTRPMQRLLQADVGAGKTAVAVYALLTCVANKHQAALMAPTEVLARQHWNTLEEYLAKSRVRRLLLTGGLSAAQRRRALEDIAAGNVDLVIGTQALVQKDVQFHKLGLVVIDEQHKFGVHQRARMRRLGTDPHYLVMTATPIPRTVALTVFGDLDVTSMRQLPPGRQKVQTRWVYENQRTRTFQHVRLQIEQGRQAYIVCPLVEESETLDLKAAEQTFEELQQGPFAGLRLGLLHGRLDDKAKDQVMQAFRKHELDALVTTLVIEVGIDIPGATLMVIEHADRFGLSQLHQLRGRVSRGQVAGECILFAPGVKDEARDRLKIFCRTTDGFALAEEDARLRGLGDFFGSRQHGEGDFRFGDLLADLSILEEAREDALTLVAADAGLKKPEHEALRKAVVARYGKTLDLAEIG